MHNNGMAARDISVSIGGLECSSPNKKFDLQNSEGENIIFMLSNAQFDSERFAMQIHYTDTVGWVRRQQFNVISRQVHFDTLISIRKIRLVEES